MVLDVADTIFVVMTADLSCLKNVRLVLETMGHLGLGAGQRVKLVLNRSNAYTGISVKSAEGALRAPDRVPGRERVPRRDQRPQHRAPFLLTKADSLLGRSVVDFAQGRRQAGPGKAAGSWRPAAARPRAGTRVHRAD